MATEHREGRDRDGETGSNTGIGSAIATGIENGPRNETISEETNGGGGGIGVGDGRGEREFEEHRRDDDRCREFKRDDERGYRHGREDGLPARRGNQGWKEAGMPEGRPAAPEGCVTLSQRRRKASGWGHSCTGVRAILGYASETNW